MDDAPGTIPRIAQLHPRRPPAHKSVSLRHSPPARGTGSKGRSGRQPTALSSPYPASDKANPPSSVSPKCLSNKNSSGESSDAGRWFENTNNDAKQRRGSFADNDPPFFLHNSSSSETPPEVYQHVDAFPTRVHQPPLAQFATEGSSTEDFRSVIDDLTIANKKLKQKLKKYERLYDEHHREQKLFEVRFHGLPDHKKKELEDTLRKFASELDDGVPTAYVPVLEHQHTASSTSRFAESGYASLSASGQNSSAPSNPDNDNRKTSKSVYGRQQQSIQSYLHDIPVGLLPQSNAPMTDKSKKKLVVRRLEQIFAGKRSASGNHPHPMQQQEVAQSAATADREEREATGQQYRPEGLREAHIMAEQTNEDVGVASVTRLRSASTLRTGRHDLAGCSSSPDQRPTRPLDLDPYRAQIPVENMEYFRHLGFTPPDMISGEAPLAGHGWLYLNLLINMAQLHTLNVTPEFVKDALHEYSSHLELSRDGRKIRWKGGRDVTNHSGGSSSEHYSGSSSVNGPSSGSPSKRLKISANGTSSEMYADREQHATRLARAEREREQNKLAYKPLFFHKEDSEEDEDIYNHDVGSSGSLLQPQHAGNSSGFSSSAIQSSIMQTSSSRPRRDDGPMIFYSKAKFCTDLSGDRLGASITSPGAYQTITSHPVGAAVNEYSTVYQFTGVAEPRGPMDALPIAYDSSACSRTISSSDEFGFSPDALRDDSGNDSPNLMELEASGLGGVQPEDNFSIHVRRSQFQTTQAIDGRRPSLYPKKILDVLTEEKLLQAGVPTLRVSPRRIIKEAILSASHKSLPNSILPPASFLPFDSTSSGDVDSDLESDVSSESESESDSGEGAATALQFLDISPACKDGSVEESEEESDYSDDDGSVDMLATARQLDPKRVRASEREYDAALADRLAETIPAGSSAATAGGGSGFNSPTGRKGTVSLTRVLSHSGSARQNRQSTTSGSISSRTNLKRVRTSESVGTATKSGKTHQ